MQCIGQLRTVMAQTRESKVIAGWSFTDFRRTFGKVRRPQFKAADGEIFTKLAFQRENGSYCFVGWSRELGELTNEELKAQADTLRVVELEVDEQIKEDRKAKGLQEETYKICRRNEDFNEWEEVDI